MKTLRGYMGDQSTVSAGVLSWALILAVGLATIGGLLLTGGNPVAAVAPPLAVGFLFVLARIPLRWSATAFVFLALALEIATDAAGIWHTPLVHIGDLLGYGFSKVSRLPIAGFEVLIVSLLLIAAVRRAGGWEPGGPPAVQTASIMRDCLLIFLAGLGYSVALSLINGHGLALWKARYLAHIPFFFLFFQVALKRPEDYRAIGAAVVAAAHVKALLAAWVQLVAAPLQTGGRLAYATNHGDSILFAIAVLILLFPALQRRTKADMFRLVVFLPLPLWGMLLNGRRLVWAILAMALTVVFLSTSWRPWKARLVKAAVLAAPLFLGYFAAGWNNAAAGGIFTPIAKIRTMLDSDVDRSTLWRERETWNIAMSIQKSSALGIGLGGEYVEYMFNDDISVFYADFKGWPHNTVLGLLLLAGIPGFAALWLLYSLTVYLALRAERLASTSEERVAATICIGAIVACLAVAWGDTGSHFLQYKLAAALSMALASKLAVSTGAWPTRGQSRGIEAA